MAERFFVHVGSPKTGTTFLQQVLWSQRDLAARHGVNLPLSGLHEHFWASLDVRGLGGQPPHPLESEGAWERVVAAARQVPGTALVSHELLAAADREQARKALGGFGSDVEVHVVLTARDLLRQLTAEWQEHVKHRNQVTLPDFVDQVRRQAPERRGWFWLVQDPARILSRWGAKVPAHRVHVVTVPPPGADPNLLWQRFAGLLGLPAEEFDTSGSRSNTSLGGEQVELLRRVNAELGDRLRAPGAYPTVVKDVLAHRVLAGREGGALTLTDADAEFALGEGRAMADALAAGGYDVVGTLEDLVPGEAAVERVVSAGAYDPPADERLLEESLAVIADLLVELSVRDRRLHEQRAAVEEMRRNPLRTALSQASDERPALDRARGIYRKLRQN